MKLKDFVKKYLLLGNKSSSGKLTADMMQGYRRPNFNHYDAAQYYWDNVAEIPQDLAKFINDIPFVRYYLDKESYICAKGKESGIDTWQLFINILVNKMNNGVASMELIPYIEEKSHYSLEKKEALLNMVVGGASSEMSIPYLLQILNTTYFLEKLVSRGPEEYTRTRTEREERYACRNYDMEWTDEVDRKFDCFRQEIRYIKEYPFAEVAYVKLNALLVSISTKELKDKVEKELVSFNDKKQVVHSKTEEFCRFVDEEVVGWHN